MTYQASLCVFQTTTVTQCYYNTAVQPRSVLRSWKLFPYRRSTGHEPSSDRHGKEDVLASPCGIVLYVSNSDALLPNIAMHWFLITMHRLLVAMNLLPVAMHMLLVAMRLLLVAMHLLLVATHL